MLFRIIKLCTIIILLLARSIALCQICTGFLGENIFRNGDFGSGSDNIVAKDPKLAPGYIYTTSTPPSDGFYIITNDMRKWSKKYDWLEITDNSNDPNGYMMVVNASHNPGVFYELKVDGLCEKTSYQFSADIINVIRPGDNLIKPKIKFLIDDVVRYNTGEVPEDAKWHTFGFTFETKLGQTSVILKLVNDAPGGYGNDLAIDNIEFKPCGPEAYIKPSGISKTCFESLDTLTLVSDIIGNQYKTPVIQWQQSLDSGQSWSDIENATDQFYFHQNYGNRKKYFYRYKVGESLSQLSSKKCIVYSDLKIVQKRPKYHIKSDSICKNLVYQFGRKKLDKSGHYIDTFTSSHGCDSIVELDLTVVDDLDIIAKLKINNPTCFNYSNGKIDIIQIRNARLPIDVKVNDVLQKNIEVVNLKAGVYNYRIQDRIGCWFDSSVKLVNPKPFIINLSPKDTFLDLGMPLNIVSSFNYPIKEVRFSLPDLTSCFKDCDLIKIFPKETGRLILTAVSEKGCIHSDSMNIKVKKVRTVFIPSSFTPNDDDLNELFLPIAQFPQVVQFDDFTIYNRWGGVVYRIENINPTYSAVGWDGTQKGINAPSGVYFYSVKVRYLDDEVQSFRGTVHLLR